MVVSRRAMFIGLAGTIAAAVGVVVVVLFAGGGDAPTPAAYRPAPFSAQEADRMAADLRSGDEARVRAAIAIPSGQAVDAGFVARLATLRSVTIDPTSLVITGKSATVTTLVTDEGGTTRHWVYYLVDTGGRWKIAETVEGTP